MVSSLPGPMKTSSACLYLFVFVFICIRVATSCNNGLVQISKFVQVEYSLINNEHKLNTLTNTT